MNMDELMDGLIATKKREYDRSGWKNVTLQMYADDALLDLFQCGFFCIQGALIRNKNVDI